MINKKSLWKNKYFLFVALAATILIIAIAYVKIMTMMVTTRMAVNVNKVEDVEHLVSYSVYSDFYYRVMEIDNNGRVDAEYARIVPLVAELGIEIDNGSYKPLLKSRRGGEPLILGSRNDNQVRGATEMMERFALEHAKLVAVNDPDYFREAVKRASALSDGFIQFGDDETLTVGAQFKELSPSIENIKSTPALVTEISKNLKSVNVCQRVWCPELFSLSFGEDERIAFQMVWRSRHVTPDNFKSFIIERSPNSYVYKTVTHNNNVDLPVYVVFESERSGHHANRATTYFMDSNGYLYQLLYDAYNPVSFERYFSDYMKIVNSIAFVDVENFKNEYYVTNNEISSKLAELSGFIKESHQDELFYQQNGFTEHFSISSYFESDERAFLLNFFTSHNFSSIDAIEPTAKQLYDLEERLGKLEDLDVATLIYDAHKKERELIRRAFDYEYSQLGFTTFRKTVAAAEMVTQKCSNIECLETTYGEEM